MGEEGRGRRGQGRACALTGSRSRSPTSCSSATRSKPGFAKTAFGLRDWAPELCVGEFALAGAKVSAGLPQLRPADAADRGARSLVIGVANSGGFIAETWVPALVEALEAGLDIVSGMHAKLTCIPELRYGAERLGRRLIDMRKPPEDIPIATGLKRTGKRLLTVGTDCALGKKYTALSIARAFAARGIDADFRATGQTGIMISGGGIPMDAVVSDFAAGAAEMLSPDAAAGSLGRDRRARARSFIPPMPACRLRCCTEASQTCSSSVTIPGRKRLLGDEEFRGAKRRRDHRSDHRARAPDQSERSGAGGIALNTSALTRPTRRDLCAGEAEAPRPAGCRSRSAVVLRSRRSSTSA